MWSRGEFYVLKYLWKVVWKQEKTKTHISCFEAGKLLVTQSADWHAYKTYVMKTPAMSKIYKTVTFLFFFAEPKYFVLKMNIGKENFTLLSVLKITFLCK